MAKEPYLSYPLDVPSIVGNGKARDGVRYPENNTPGDAKFLAVEPDAPIRRAKGDLGMTQALAPRALTGKGPTKNLQPAPHAERVSKGTGPWK